MVVSEASDEPEFLLATEPPTLGQRRLAFIIVITLLVALGVTAPFADLPLPRINALIPTVEGIFCVNDLITAALLFAQFSIIRSSALLVLATGYLFTALIVIPHALTFPGVFSPTGLLGAGPQSTVWLYFFWHIGFPTAMLFYALLKDDERAKRVTQVSVRSAVGWSVAITISLVCGLAWLATMGKELLPQLMLNTTVVSPLANYVATFTLVICVLGLALLWRRRRSVLDLWLIVVVCTSITEMVVSVVLISARFSLGWYAGRIFSLATSIIVLVVILAETTSLYARLAHSNVMLRRQRDNKLMNLRATVASISHEVNQPLSAIALRGGAALRFLGKTPPNLEEARKGLNAMVSDSLRASEVFNNIGALLGHADRGTEPIDINEIALGVLRILRGELEEHGITAHAELTPGLPLVVGHKGQLQEVMLNLIHNAVEAMDAIEERSRVLRVSTQRDGSDSIAVAVQDSGPGIDPEKLTSIFDAFVTTKPQGTGLGLAICRTIVGRHGGQLTAFSDKKQSGALFQFTLPIKSAAGFTAAPL